ncbi:MAG: DUF1553 domain-containing protein, partial [Verrucomicrobiota bacterium]
QLDRERPEGSMAQAAGDSRIAEGRRGDATSAFNTAPFRGRSIYLPILRDSLPDELGLFDFPDPQGTIGQRSATNVAPQSLHLMNSELVYLQSRTMAELLEKNFSSVRDQVSNAFLLSYSRPATSQELSRGLQFLSSFDPGRPPAPDPTPAPVAGKGKGKGKGGKGKGKGKGSPTPAAEAVEEKQETISPMTEHQTKLAALCQALMMSSEFRTIH